MGSLKGMIFGSPDPLVLYQALLIDITLVTREERGTQISIHSSNIVDHIELRHMVQ